MLDVVASRLRAHGFEHIVFIADSGGNAQGMANVAARLHERWDDAHAHHIPEYYRYGGGDFLKSELGIVETENDGIHDSFGNGRSVGLNHGKESRKFNRECTICCPCPQAET